MVRLVLLAMSLAKVTSEDENPDFLIRLFSIVTDLASSAEEMGRLSEQCFLFQVAVLE